MGDQLNPVDARFVSETRARAEAVAAARENFEQYARLRGMIGEGKDLTPRQEDDLRSAQVHYNDDARALGLEEIRAGQDLSDEELDKILKTLFRKEEANLRAIDETLRHAELSRRMPAWIKAISDPKSGLAPGTRSGGTDEIRTMLESKESRADFAFAEPVEAFRLEESRAIANFSDGTSIRPVEFAQRVAVYARTLSPWINLATVITSDNGRDLTLPMLTADSTTYTPGEGTAITESSPTLDHVTAVTVGYKDLTYISWESFEDEDVNLTDLIAKAHARSLALAFGSAATTAIVAGITNAGTATGAGGYGTATGAFIGYEDLIDLKYSAPAPYRASASWVMANTAIKKGRKWRDGQGGYLWSPQGGLSGASSDTLDGQPVYEDPYLAAVGSATKSAIYGDVRSALTIKASPMRVAISTDFRFSTDQIAVKTVQRLALAIPDPLALRYIVSANS